MATGIEEREFVQIKGLQGTLALARKQIAAVRSEVAALSDDTARLHKTLVEVRSQVNQVHADLKFEAENLGNEPVQQPIGSGFIAPDETPSRQPAEPLRVIPTDQSIDRIVIVHPATNHGSS